jgi:hypothetical protein
MLEIRAVGPAHLIERIREIGATRVRYGYRRIHVRVNAKTVYQLWSATTIPLLRVRRRRDRWGKQDKRPYQRHCWDLRSLLIYAAMCQHD